MTSSKVLKERMESIQDTMKITNAMYLISSAKLRKARKQQSAVSTYFKTMQETIARVLPHIDPEEESVYFDAPKTAHPRRAYVVLTGDKGMAGAFNSNVIKYAEQLAQGQPDALFFVVGQTGYRYFDRKDDRLVRDFLYSGQAPTISRARHITVELLDDFHEGKLDEIYLVYTKMKNALTAEPVKLRLLPLEPSRFKVIDSDMTPVEFFPSARSVLNQTAPIYMHGIIFAAMTESYCAEQNARMSAMDSATDNAREMIRTLQLEYNRSRQSAITQEITEIVGGSAAFQNDMEDL